MNFILFYLGGYGNVLIMSWKAKNIALNFKARIKLNNNITSVLNILVKNANLF